MKRLGLIMMSVALVLGMAQCKKNVEPLASGVVPGVGDGEIVLRLVGESSKLAVFPATGAVYYTEGDVIHVASGGTYRGTLTYHSDDDGGYFSGNLTSIPSSGAKLYFYFVGNKSLNEGSPTSSISVNISDQTENYPVIACGESVEGYGETTEYHATMKNKCALVKFNVRSSASSSTPTVVFGMNTVIKFTFSGSGVGTAATSSVGSIKLRGGSGERWAVALKQNEVESLTYSFIENSEIYTSAHGSIPAINDNDYLSRGIGVTVASGEFPEGTVHGLFTINSSGDHVFFANGDVEYVDGTYSFSSTQWTDRTGTPTTNKYYFSLAQANNAVEGLNSASYQGTNTWRTLTRAEWLYVLNTRTTVDGTAGQNHNWKWITISDVTQAGNSNNSMTGALLFPDGYGSVDGVSSSLTVAELLELEAAGCVFMPAAGRVSGSSIGYAGTYVCLRYTDLTNRLFISSTGVEVFGTSSQYYQLRVVTPVE